MRTAGEERGQGGAKSTFSHGKLAQHGVEVVEESILEGFALPKMEVLLQAKNLGTC